MKLNKVLCLFLMLTLVLSLASCALFVKYDVVFDSNGGSPTKTQVVRHGDPVSVPAIPFRDGYTFLGWFCGEDEWDFETPIKEDVTLVAHWEQNCVHEDKDDNGRCDKCSIAYSDGSDLPESFRIVYYDGSDELHLQPSSYTSNSGVLELPTPRAKTHYDFVGWFTDADLTKPATGIDVNAGKALIFYAKFVPTTYSVNYMLDSGVNSEENPISVTVLDLPVVLSEPTREGYFFKGWFTDANCTEQITEITEENIGSLTVYAKWEKAPASFTVTYLDTDGSVIATERFYESANDQPIKKTHKVDGYTFLGWLDKDGNKVSVIPAGNTADITLTADMQKNIVTAKVIYYIDGIESHTDVFDVEKGLDSLMSANKGGFTFDGWYSHPNCTGELVTSIAAGTTEDVVLYGKYTAITYTVTYYDKDGNLLSLTPATYQFSETDTALPLAPTVEGYTLLGWYTESGEKLTSIPKNSYGDLVLYATYEPAKYTVIYVLNGGQNNDQNLTEYSHGNLPTLHDPIARDGYCFAGWYTDPTFSAASIVTDFGDCANRNVILYAKWTLDIESSGSGSGTLTPEVPF